jgi:DNA (cytosine-5)-methyltransferase 1
MSVSPTRASAQHWCAILDAATISDYSIAPALGPDLLTSPRTLRRSVMTAQAVKAAPVGRFVDLFAGCGGFSLGLMQAGWQGLFAVERDKHAFATLSHNFLGTHTGRTFDWPAWLPREPIEIAHLNRRYWRKLRALQGSVDLLVGGPPCQGYSFAGRRRPDDHRNQLVDRYLAVVDQIHPTMVLLENVRGIEVEFGREARRTSGVRGRRPEAHSDRIRKRLEERGYEVFTTEVRAVDCGVPQQRPRFILTGIRRDSVAAGRTLCDPFAAGGIFDQQRIAFLSAKGLPLGHPVCVAEAISDLETARKGARLEQCPSWPRYERLVYKGPRTAYQELLREGAGDNAPNSMRLVNHRPPTRARFERMIRNCRKGVCLSAEERRAYGMGKKNVVVILDPNEPAHTLTTLPDDFLHYSEPRILTVREYARLQAFPDWFAFKGKYTTGGGMRTKEAPRYTQVGNAVSPFVAEILGNMAKEVLRGIAAPLAGPSGTPEVAASLGGDLAAA